MDLALSISWYLLPILQETLLTISITLKLSYVTQRCDIENHNNGNGFNELDKMPRTIFMIIEWKSAAKQANPLHYGLFLQMQKDRNCH